MGSLSSRTLERQLLALDGDAFVEFVSALWRESGWTVHREGAVLELSREGASKRLLVLPPRRVTPSLRQAPATNGPIDLVVAPYAVSAASELPRGTPNAEVVDVAGIRDRLYYALDEEARTELLTSWLDFDAENAVSPTDAVRPLPPLRASSMRGMAAGSVGVVLLTAGILLLVVGTGVPFGGSSSSGTVDATEPSSAGSVSTVSASAYQAEQTCDRSPAEVVQVSTAAVRGSSLSRGLVVMGNFWNPAKLESSPTGSWYDRMQSTSRLPFYTASELTVEEPSVDGDEAVINATATDDGIDYPYRFELSQVTTDSGEQCWMLDHFVPA